jgi:hypothetical protein
VTREQFAKRLRALSRKGWVVARDGVTGDCGDTYEVVLRFEVTGADTNRADAMAKVIEQAEELTP